jgi:hypothetical protein
MVVWAMGSVGVVMAASFYHVSHVVSLGATFEVVWVHTAAVVAGVSHDRGPVEVGDVEREAVDGGVLAIDVELAVAVAT